MGSIYYTISPSSPRPKQVTNDFYVPFSVWCHGVYSGRRARAVQPVRRFLTRPQPAEPASHRPSLPWRLEQKDVFFMKKKIKIKIKNSSATPIIMAQFYLFTYLSRHRPLWTFYFFLAWKGPGGLRGRVGVGWGGNPRGTRKNTAYGVHKKFKGTVDLGCKVQPSRTPKFAVICWKKIYIWNEPPRWFHHLVTWLVDLVVDK